MRQRILAQAEQLWLAGDPYNAGRIIFTNLVNKHRPSWAAAALEFAYRESGIAPIPEIDRLLIVANAPLEQSVRWAEADGLFGSLRQLTLRFDRTGQYGQMTERVVSLAETVAKVAANAYVDLTYYSLVTRVPGGPSRQAGRDLPMAPKFDPHSGYKLVVQLHAIADRIGGQEALDRAWLVLSYGRGTGRITIS